MRAHRELLMAATVDWLQVAGRAANLDAEDTLARWRREFSIPPGPDGDSVYLCGNSLGLMPRSARLEVERVLADWQRLAVHGHFQAEPSWFSYHEALAPQLAALVGAGTGEVVVMNSLTANLHLLMVSFYRPAGRRRKIVMEAGAFPSDAYAVASQLRWHGLDPATDLVLLEPRSGEERLRLDDVEDVLRRQDDELALLLLPGVQYRTGQWLPVEHLTALAQAQGAMVGVDLAHAVGNMPLQLHDWGVDFAVWCHYKYLNAGPGAPGGAFVHQRHGSGQQRPQLRGWWGTDPRTRFLMEDSFQPQDGAGSWQLSNPPILAMAALKGSLDLFHQVGLPALRQKSEQLTGFLYELVTQALPDVSILTPAETAARGCQLSLRLGPEARQVVEDLEQKGIVCDFRQPDIIRVAPTPFYNTFSDIVLFIRALLEARSGC